MTRRRRLARHDFLWHGAARPGQHHARDPAQQHVHERGVDGFGAAPRQPVTERMKRAHIELGQSRQQADHVAVKLKPAVLRQRHGPARTAFGETRQGGRGLAV